MVEQINLIEGAKSQKMMKAVKYAIRRKTHELIEKERREMLMKYQKLTDLLKKNEY